MRQLSIISIVLLVLFGCTNKQTSSFTQSTINLNSIELEHFTQKQTHEFSELINPSHINIVGKYIVFVSTTVQGIADSKVLHLYDKNDLAYYGSFIHFGRGKNETFQINPNYFYALSDTSFLLNTNTYEETEYVIKNNSINVKSKRQIINEMPGNIYRVNNTKYIVLNSEQPESLKYEYTEVSINNTQPHFTKNYISEFPKFCNAVFEGWQYGFAYNKSIVTHSNYLLSFYFNFPYIRKYNHNLELIAEYKFNTDYKYNFSSYEDVSNNGNFILLIRNFKDKVCIFTKDNEFVILDKDCTPIKKFTVDIDLSTVAAFNFDDEYLYFLNTSNDPYTLTKFAINK